MTTTINISEIIELAEENASSCKMSWGMDVDYAFELNNGKKICIIDNDCFEAIDTNDCFDTHIVGEKLDNNTVVNWF